MQPLLPAKIDSKELNEKAGGLILLPFKHISDKMINGNREAQGRNRHFPKFCCMNVQKSCRN